MLRYEQAVFGFNRPATAAGLSVMVIKKHLHQVRPTASAGEHQVLLGGLDAGPEQQRHERRHVCDARCDFAQGQCQRAPVWMRGASIGHELGDFGEAKARSLAEITQRAFFTPVGLRFGAPFNQRARCFDFLVADRRREQRALLLGCCGIR